jgi:gentisate 1,2-dioxygenase
VSRKTTEPVARQRFSREVARKNLKPLWERRQAPQSQACALSAIWRYADVRPALLRAGELITAPEAERRVLVLENPALAGTLCITPTLFAGFQLILPGENAPAHRHTANALRFIVEGNGAYTTMNGARIEMHPGDFVVTRGWTWHDHGNGGSQPVIWMDGLDSPLARIFGAHFRQQRTDEMPSVACEADEPLVYPYAGMRDGLQALAREAQPHVSHGYRQRYSGARGEDPIPTLAVFLQWLPAGFLGSAYCSTGCSVFNVAEGQGIAKIGDSVYEFAPHDVVVVPSWTPYSFKARQDCVLFSYSDRAAQEALGFWRELL